MYDYNYLKCMRINNNCKSSRYFHGGIMRACKNAFMLCFITWQSTYASIKDDTMQLCVKAF